MVRINRVYTRAGDDGTTALASGIRVPKDALRVEAYGTVDELNSLIGVALASGVTDALREPLEVTQHVLFNLGADLSTPAEGRKTMAIPQVKQRHIDQLETWIDTLNEPLAELKSFVLPGGTAASAALHVARAVCRRAERRALSLVREEEVGQFVIPYLNRLSDLLFVAARFDNHAAGAGDILWESRRF